MTSSRPTTRLRRILLHPIPVTLVILTGLWMLFFWRLLTPNLADRVLFAEGDFTQHYYAFASYAAERLWQGQLPLWNPYNHAGAPFIANVQWATWYPLQWLAIWLSGPGGLTIEAYQFLTAGHVWLASLLTYAFLRVALPDDKDDPRDTDVSLARHKTHWAALAGAVIFAYGGYLTGYPILQPSIIMAATWLPLLLLGLHLSVTRAGWRIGGALIAGLAVGVSFFGGHPQTTMYITYAGLAYLVFLGWQTGLRWHEVLWRAALFGAVGGGLSAVLLLPAQEYAALSARVAEYGYDAKSNGFAPIELMQLIWPQAGGAWSPLYVGVAGIVLAVGALRRPRPAHVFWAGVALVALLLSLGKHSVVYEVFYKLVPGFSTFRQQERAALLVSFGLSMLAAFQLQRLLSGEASARDLRTDALLYAALTGGALLFVGLLGWALGDPPGADAGRSFGGVLAMTALFTILLLGWATWRDRRLAIRPAWLPANLLIALIVVDLFSADIANQNYVPDTSENRVAEPGGYGVIRPHGGQQWRVDGALGLQGYGTYFRVPDVYSTGPFALASISDLLTIPVDRFWEVLGVRYVTLAPDVQPPVPADLVGDYVNYSGEPYRLYEIAEPRPLVWLVYDYREASGSAAFARQIMADSRVNLRQMAITLTPLPFDLPGSIPEEPHGFEWRRPAPELFLIDAATPANALLTVSLPRYPGWQATVDGVPVETVDVYAGLTGIPLTPGDHHIMLRFRPTRVIIGGWISGLTVLACAGYGVFVLVKRPANEIRDG